MGGNSSQTTGFKYFKAFARVLGNAIEGIWAVKFDDKEWIYGRDNKLQTDNISIGKPDLFGENDGVAGIIEIERGLPNQQPNPAYQNHDELISGFPYQSMLVFHGNGQDGGFYIGNNSLMKETMIWAKRTKIKNDGSVQWYESRAEIIGDPENNCTCIAPFISPLRWKLNGTDLLDNYQSHIIRLNIEPTELRGQLVFSFDIVTGKEVEFSSNKFRILSTAGEFSISSSETISVLTNDISDTYWAQEHDITVTVSAMDANIKKQVSVYFDYNLEENIEQYYAGIYIEMNLPSPLSGFVCNTPPIGIDINPIHKIREILTDYNALNKPEEEIDEASFAKSALRIYEEGLGISWCIRDKDCLEAINELCYHIEAGCRVNRQTGLYEMVLFRDDWFEEGEIHVMPEGEIKSMKPELTDAQDLINKLNVKFYNRAETKDGATSISDVGLVKTMGRIATEDADFPYFQNQRNAIVSANWKLKKLSTPRWSGTFTTGRKDARKWNRYDLIKLTWSRRWQGEILVRITSINIGTATNSEVTIKFEEVVNYSSMTNSVITYEAPTNKPMSPQLPISKTFEVPYYPLVMAYGQRVVEDEIAFNKDYGIAGAIAIKPQPNSIYAVFYHRKATESDRLASITYSSSASSTDSSSKTDHTITIENGTSFGDVNFGDLIFLNDEWMSYVNHTDTTLIVKRGLLDTHPKTIGNGSQLFICGDNIANSETEFTAGESQAFEVVTVTPSGVSPSAFSTIEFNARAIRPYPPQNVRVDGEYFGEIFSGDLTIEWSHRNRQQQTSPTQHIDWYDGSVTLEEGVTYVLKISQYDSNEVLVSEDTQNIGTVDNYTFLESEFEPSTVKITFELKTIRGEYECLYPFSQTLVSNDYFSAPYDITYTVS